MTPRTRTHGRPIAVALALLLVAPLLIGATPGGNADAHACRSGGGVVGDGTWTIVPIPGFPVGEAQPRRHVSHPLRPGTHFVTNGSAVLRTTDGGCSWAEVFTLPTAPTPAQPFTAETGRIVDIAVSRESTSADRVYVLVLDLAQGGVAGDVADPPTVAHVVRSDNGGAAGSFRKVDQGMQPVGRAGGGDITGCGPLSGCFLRVAPSNGAIVYVALSPQDTGPGTLQGSADGGVTWTTLPAPTGAEGANGIEQLAINPAQPYDIWIDHGGVLRSPDGGNTWTRQADGLTGFRPVLDVTAAGSGTRVLTISSPERRLPAPVGGAAVRPLGGNDFTPVSAAALDLDGAQVESGVTGRAPVDIVLSAGGTVYAYDAGDDRFVDVDPRAHARTFGPFRNAQAVSTSQAGQAFTFLGTGVLAVYHGPTGEDLAGADPAVAFPPLTVPPPPPARPATIEPSGAEVEIAPDTTVDLGVTLDLPAPPRVVDVFFLMDTSISMQPTVDGLAVGLPEIARRIAAAGVDAHFGLAEFQDSDSHSRGKRYERLVDVGPPTPQLQRELGRIHTQGGNEPHLTALDQMATGSGVLGPSAGLGVEPGQGASWRPDSMRVAVMITNEPYGRDASPETRDATDSNGPDPDGPSEATAMAHLREDATRVVGVRIVTPEQQVGLGDDVGEARDKLEANRAREAIAAATLEDLTRWAEKTDAVAPTGGIDCDSDGNVDVPTGSGMVCTIFEQESATVNDLTNPLVRLILSLAETAPVDLTATVESRAGPGLTVELAPRGDFRAVNLGADQRLDFGMTLGCTRDQAGQAFRIRLDARVEGEVVASAPLTLICGALPIEDAPGVTPPAPRVVPPPAPPGPPPAPINAPVPATAPAPAAAAVSAAAPAAAPGFAPPPAVFDGGPAEVQVRLANEARARRGRMFLASARDEPAVPPIVLTLLGAVVLTAIAAAVAAPGGRRRQRLAHVRATSRSDGRVRRRRGR